MFRSKLHRTSIYLIILQFAVCYGFSQTIWEKTCSECVSASIAQLPNEPDVVRMAILPLTADETGELTNRIVTAVVARGDYQVIDRQQLKILLNEAEFQMTDDVDPKTAVRAGKIAGVDAVLYGEVKRQLFGDDWADLSFHIQAVKVQNGEIFWADDEGKKIGKPPKPPIEINPIWLYGGIAAALILAGAVVLLLRSRKSKATAGGSGQVEIVRHADKSEVSNDRILTPDATPKIIRRKD